MQNNKHISRLAEEGLLEESVEDLYDHAPCGYFSTLPDGTFIKTNSTFLSWLGYESSQLLYVKKLQDLLGIGDAIFYDTHYYPLLQMQGGVNEINFALKKHNGILLPALLNTVVVNDAEGKPALFRTTVFDITDRKKYETELILAKRKAEEAARVKTEFLSTVSHEIRTPINAIVGIVHLLRSTSLTPQQAEYLSVLEISTENLLKLINNVLDFSRIEAGKLSLDEESINLRELLYSVVHGFKAKANEKGLSLTLVLDEKVPETLLLDPLKLVQVLNNLLSNAIKFTEHGSIELKVELRELKENVATLKFSVTDTGIGIAADNLELIFEEFAQANARINRTYGGTGLGLAISRRLLDLYNSRLEVQSEQGKGSTFCFTLSLQVSQKAPNGLKPKQRTGTAKGVRLLLVEDNNINVYVLSQYLKNWGVAFDVAVNGQEALEKVTEQDYDLVLMDLQMPVMDGYEASRRIRSMEGEKYQQLPIIALTAAAQSDYEGKLSEAGMNGIFPKPFNPEKLHSLLQSYAPDAASFTGFVHSKQQQEKVSSSYNLTVLDELMAGDPVGMADVLNITYTTLQEADKQLARYLRQYNYSQFSFWVQKLQTSLDLLHARQLQSALDDAKELLKRSPQQPDKLEKLGHIISLLFRAILKGLEERVKAI